MFWCNYCYFRIIRTNTTTVQRRCNCFNAAAQLSGVRTA